MSLTNLLLAAYFILVGLSLLGILAVSNTVLGIIALIVGIIILVDGFHPITWNRRSA